MSWPTAAAAPAPVITPAERDTAILAWRKAQDTLAAAKEDEMNKREALSKMLFPNPTKGTQRYDLGGGYAVKLVHKVNYSIDQKGIQDTEDAILKLGPKGEFLVDRIVKWKADLSVSEYNKLVESTDPVEKQVLALIQGVVTSKDAAPTLELEEPKAK